MSETTGRIEYVSPNIPEVEFPPVEGESYEALVPDTLDIAERADYGIQCSTSIADPEADYEIWWHAVLNRKPAVMGHDFHDLNIQFKFQEALPLLRIVTGDTRSLEVDRAWAESLLRMQGEDGLVYMPVNGRPWAHFHADWLTEEGWDQGSQLASIVANGGWIGVMGLHYLLSQDEVWRQRGQRLVDRMAQLMVYKDDYCYFPVMHAIPGTQVSPDMPMVDPECTREACGACAGWIINGLCQLYLPTDYGPALDLAGKLATYLMRYSGCFDARGQFTGVPHTHLHTRPISGLLEYALIAKNEEIAEYCRSSYEYAKAACGSATVGFFPSVPGPDAVCDNAAIQRHFDGGVEGCTAADMVALAIKLSQAGLGDYWDDADRYIRNQFAEMQLLQTDWVDRTPPELPTQPWASPQYESADRVVERNIGACMSIASPNDFVGHPIHYHDRPTVDHLFLMHCCTGNYIRAIWYVWDNILDYEDGELKVNLLLNRASRWADVESHIPYEGQVDVVIKQACSLWVRIPEWVKPEETACSVEGQSRSLHWEGRYAGVGAVGAGDVVNVMFPIAERTVRERLAGVDYTMIIKGNSVVFVDPPSKYYPFYQRAHYRQNRVRWVKRTRFASSQPSPQWHY